MTNANNPPRRLHDLLTEARSKPQGVPAASAWCEILGLEFPRDTAALLSCGVSLLEQAALIRRVVTERLEPATADAILGSFQEVESTLGRFAIIASDNMGNFLGPLNDTGMQSLLFAASVWPRDAIERTIDEAMAIDLLKKTRDLIDEIDAADIDAAAKRIMIERLGEVEQSLLNLKTSGIARLERAVDAAIGVTHREPGAWRRIWEAGLGGALGSLLWAIAQQLGAPTDQGLLPAAPETLVIQQVIVAPPNGQVDDIIDAEIVGGNEGPLQNKPDEHRQQDR